MAIFTKHNESTSPAEAAKVLSAAKQRYGFVPNLASYLAESPLVLGAVLTLSEQFDQSSLSPQEQQVVLLTISTLNNCSYCRTVHTGLGKMAEVSSDDIQSTIACNPLSNPRLESLRRFTSSIWEEKGSVDEKVVREFLDAGFSKAQVFEVILGVALKTLTNYSNHIAGAEPNQEFIVMAEDAVAA